ncbi:MAG: translation initiation factor IF-2 subunit gamma [Candidatus Micrarchaeia archaeon]
MSGNVSDMMHSVLNIGTLGHIDHGKTSITRAITHVWTDKHSESIKRNMTIKLGYADAIIRKCECDGTIYTTEEKCPKCGSETKPVMRISILDSPGHETLMATAISASSLIDGIIFVIAANEPCPMQQTKEHLMIINILGIKNVIIAQTKIDIVGKDAAQAHYQQIKNFIKGSIIEDAPIVPVIANLNINIDVLLEKITNMEIPKRDTSSDPLLYVARSFDINKPGSDVSKIKGGIIGGSLIRGVIHKDDKIEIRPGIKLVKTKRETYEPIITIAKELSNGTDKIDVALPGGLIGIETEIDPTFTKADGLVGNVVGLVGKLPPVLNSISLNYTKLNRNDIPEQVIGVNEPLILGVGTNTTIGYVQKAKKNNIEVTLKHPVCAEKGMRIAIMRNIGKRWRLTGYGIIS